MALACEICGGRDSSPDSRRSLVTCPLCRAAFHASCRDTEARCSTLGCGGEPPAELGSPLRHALIVAALLTSAALSLAVPAFLKARREGRTLPEPVRTWVHGPRLFETQIDDAPPRPLTEHGDCPACIDDVLREYRWTFADPEREVLWYAVASGPRLATRRPHHHPVPGCSIPTSEIDPVGR